MSIQWDLSQQSPLNQDAYKKGQYDTQKNQAQPAITGRLGFL